MNKVNSSQVPKHKIFMRLMKEYIIKEENIFLMTLLLKFFFEWSLLTAQPPRIHFIDEEKAAMTSLQIPHQLIPLSGQLGRDGDK